MAEKVIVVTGPTASGKTRLGIELAQRYKGEIVSADSMQIYRGMDIGTAKANTRERQQAVHHMLDIIEPCEDYSVSKYVEAASACCDDIISRGKRPIIVGGTGLYIESLISGRDFAARPDSDEELRNKLSAQYDELGGEAMLKTLSSFDPERAAKLPAGDKRRIVRAIEVYMLSGISITEHDNLTRALPPRYDAATIVLSFKDRAELYSRINRRVDAMLEQGLFKEVEALLETGLSPQCTAMQAIGYKEAVQALQGKLSREDAAEQIKLSSRRYAKRQLTWFSRNTDALRLRWDSTPDFSSALLDSTNFLLHHGIS